MKTKHLFTKLFPIILLLAIFCGIPTEIQAQFGVQRKVKRKVGQRVDRKIDEAIDGALDNIFKKKKKEVEDAAEDTPDVEVKDDGEVIIDPDGEEVSVTFEDDDTIDEVVPSTATGSFSMEVSEFKKGKIQKNYPMTMTYHIDTYRFATEIDYQEDDMEGMVTIYDRQTRKTTMKTIKNGEKTAMITKMPRVKVGVSKKAIDEGKYTVTETGNTKTIEGYLCKEYLIETEDEITKAWMSEKILLDLASMSDLVRVKNAQGAMTNYNNVYKINGFMLEAHTEIKGKNITRDVYIRDLKMGQVDDNIFSTEGYQVTDVSSMFGN